MKLPSILLCASLLAVPRLALAARCTGDADCRVCTNCSRCAYCGAGGTCGVCAGTSSGRSSSSSSYDYSSDSTTTSPPYSASTTVRTTKSNKPINGLHRGMSGPQVVRWQKFLVQRGFFSGEIGGNYGPKTERATANFQTAYGLPVTGVAEPKTMKQARSLGYSDSISTKTDDNCCSTVERITIGERFPQTRRILLTPTHLRTIGDSDLRYAINEMYARYGLTFKDSAVQRQFCERDWYRPNVTRTQGQIESLMTSTERTNLKALASERYLRRENPARRVTQTTAWN